MTHWIALISLAQATPVEVPDIYTLRANLEAFNGKHLRVCGEVDAARGVVYQPGSPVGRHGRTGVRLRGLDKAPAGGCVVATIFREDGRPPARPGETNEIVITSGGVHDERVAVVD